MQKRIRPTLFSTIRKNIILNTGKITIFNPRSFPFDLAPFDYIEKEDSYNIYV